MSAYNPESCVARGVHKALSESVKIQMALGPVPRLYDNAPEDPIYPYLTYGAARSEDMSGDDTSLTAHTYTLHIWSRYGGRAETLDLMNTVRGVLVDSDLSFDDCNLISANMVYSDVFRSSDGRTLHGVMRLAFRTQPFEMEAA